MSAFDSSRRLRNRLLLTSAAIVSTVSSLQAAGNPGDLILGFVAGGGQGSNETLLLNLGPAATYRDNFDAGTNRLNFLSIGTQLATQFGATWHERNDLYVSFFGCASSNNTNSLLYSGDPARTLYVSASRTAAGNPGSPSSGGWSIGGNTSMTDSASIMVDVAKKYFEASADAQTVAVIPKSDANTLDEFTRPATNDSFGSFNGGAEQIFATGPWGTFGDAGAVEAALDLYRLQAKNNVTGQYGLSGAIREGTYKGTFTVSQTGQVSFIAKGAAAAGGFNDWAVGKGLPAGVAADDDRDADGILALVEYALDLNPLAFDTLPEPVATEGGLQFTYAKGAAAAADSKITYQIEASTTLTSGWAAIFGAVNNATQISALLPPDAAGGRNFGRLRITSAE